MKTFTRNVVMAVSTLCVAGTFSGHAAADEQGVASAKSVHGISVQTVSVPYYSAELGDAEGLASLHARIRSAAREVCGPTGLRQAGSLSMSSRNRQCYEDAVDAAVSQIGSGQLAAIGK